MHHKKATNRDDPRIDFYTRFFQAARCFQNMDMVIHARLGKIPYNYTFETSS